MASLGPPPQALPCHRELPAGAAEHSGRRPGPQRSGREMAPSAPSKTRLDTGGHRRLRDPQRDVRRWPPRASHKTGTDVKGSEQFVGRWSARGNGGHALDGDPESSQLVQDGLPQRLRGRAEGAGRRAGDRRRQRKRSGPHRHRDPADRSRGQRAGGSWLRGASMSKVALDGPLPDGLSGRSRAKWHYRPWCADRPPACSGGGGAGIGAWMGQGQRPAGLASWAVGPLPLSASQVTVEDRQQVLDGRHRPRP